MVFYIMKLKENRLNSIEKAIAVLLTFQEGRPSWGVRELSTHLDFSPATVLRVLQTLKRHDFVRQDSDTKKYRLGNIYFSFFQALQDTNPLNQAVVPFLEALRAKTRETVHFNIIEGWFRICAYSLESHQNLKASMPIGNRSPLHAGASSKCLLAFSSVEFQKDYINSPLASITENTIVNKLQLVDELEKIRRQGYAASLGERTPGLGSLSAPILNFKRKLLGGISLAIPEIRFKDYDHRSFCTEALLTVSREASDMLGYHESGD
jgi:IclR family KDG regulon transcriptional repressor